MKRLLFLSLIVSLGIGARSNAVTARSAKSFCAYQEQPTCTGGKSLVAALFYSSDTPADEDIARMRAEQSSLQCHYDKGCSAVRKEWRKGQQDLEKNIRRTKRENGIGWHNCINTMRQAFFKVSHSLTAVRFVEVDLALPGNKSLVKKYQLDPEQPTLQVFMDGEPIEYDAYELQLNPCDVSESSIKRFVKLQFEPYLPKNSSELICECPGMNTSTPAMWDWGPTFERYALWPYRGPIYGAPVGRFV